ncbi:ATP-dependent helicase [uncultured Shewanella sp.]|uniref:UvrD-helicase domain-containing protein n=1 Tax=uncultured Shewanella sp. TaxID=173975 RepID=UPI00262852D8|nr:ATP-dependent helicase [uncultured Shewanella sp.]
MSAVKYEDNMLLTACPGSGKTKTLVSKLYHMLDNAESLAIGKRKIVAITYTNIAAETICERLLSYGVESNSLWIGTIHSFCLQWVIRPNINKIRRLCGGFIVIDQHEREEKLSELKLAHGIGQYEQVITTLSLSYEPVYQKGTKEYRFVKEYHRYLADNDSIDFDLILNISYRLLEKNPKLTSRLAKLLYHVLVDEYQDTSEIQYEILKLIITHKSTKITLIGDVEQAIYTGLGAIVKDKSELENFFDLKSCIEEKMLTGCFRSSQKIIDHYIRYQDAGYKVKATSKLIDFNSVVDLQQDIDKSQLAAYVIAIIETHLNQGVYAEEIAVLCPSWFDVIGLSKEIDSLEKSFKVDGVLISPIPKNQDNLWLPLIRLILTKVDMRNFIKRRRLAIELSEKLYESAATHERVEPRLLLQLINSITLDVNREIVSWIDSAVNTFCSKLNVNLDETTIAYSSKRSIIDATIERMKKYKMNYQAYDLERFFSSSNGVKIAVFHSSKGDEYDVVICTGLLHGKVPNWKDIYGCSVAHQNYVARRLLYVIASRARKHLYLVSEKGHETSGKVPYVATMQL